MKKINFLDFPNIKFGKNVKIISNNIVINDGVVIEDNVHIEAENIYIGYNSKIESDTVVRGLGICMKTFFVGDNSLIGFRNQILVTDFMMKDFSQLHNSCLTSGYKPLKIGYNCWIGQNSILNSTENLIIENNVRIGTGSQLWTHVASGELLEGCSLYGNNPLHLKDNVWIVGGAVISPGLILEKNSIIMTGSVLTKSTTPFSTFAGVPAKDVTEKLSFWNDISLDDQIKMLDIFINDFYKKYPEYTAKIHLLNNLDEELIEKNKTDVFILKQVNLFAYIDNKISIFDLSSKKYIKTRSKLEIDWIMFNVGYRARFIPIV